ncbi:DUF4397 domain-containing protein [candidate division KSB1 bacterium]|nr:DUF4397 domain-containing protein [candidate division KSB1 bacterium]
MRFTIILTGTALCTLLLFLAGCSDVPSTAPEFPDFRTQTRFINVAVDVGDVELFMELAAETGDFSSLASIEMEGNTSYMDLPAGNRRLFVTSGGTMVDEDTTRLSLETDAKTTIVVLPKPTAADRRFANFRERRVFDPLPAGTGQVRFINASIETGSFVIFDTNADTVVVSNLARAGNTGYRNFSGSFTFGVAATDTTEVLTTEQVDVGNGQRFTFVILGDEANLGLKSFQDDPAPQQ